MKDPGRVWFRLSISLLTALLIGCSESFSDGDFNHRPSQPTDSPATPRTIAFSTANVELADTPTIQQSPVLPRTSTPLATDTRLPTRTATPTSEPVATTASFACDTPGQIITGQFQSAISGSWRSYRLYLPPCYGENDRVYPTLYMFHGGVQNDSHWDTLGLDEAANSLILAGQIPPLLIVMPDGGQLANESSGGLYSFEGVVLNELIPHIETTYCAWREPRGRAIGGLSRGGYWALEIAFRNPDAFVSVGGHSAALLDTTTDPTINPQYTGLNMQATNLRIYMDIGKDDYVIANIRRLHEEMSGAQISHDWHLNEGFHEDAYWSLHVSEYLEWYAMPWLLQKEELPLCLPQNN